MPKHPCIGCVYYIACGETNRTMPCNGRVTKSERKRGKANGNLLKTERKTD